MSGLIIDSEACIGCGRCVRACASGGIVVEGERPSRCARVTDGCILCGGCVDACPVNAISIERDEAAGAVDLDAYRDIWVFAQTDEHDTVTPVAYELMGKGRELADARGCRLVALVGMSPEGSLGDLEHLVCAGADEVLACRDERLRQNDAEVYARLICDLVAERKPEAILYGATAFGRELAPGVAVRLQTGLTADCTVLSMDTETGLLQQTRPAFGGNLMATIVCPNHRPQMATVRPGIFKAPDFDYDRSGTITRGGREGAESFSLIRRNPRGPQPFVLPKRADPPEALFPKQNLPLPFPLHELPGAEKPPARRKMRAQSGEERRGLLVDHVRGDDVEERRWRKRLERPRERGDAGDAVCERLLARRERRLAVEVERDDARGALERRHERQRPRAAPHVEDARAGEVLGEEQQDREARGLVRPGAERADGGEIETPDAGRRNAGQDSFVGVEEVPLHENGAPQGGRFGNPVAGDFFEGGKAGSSDRVERGQGCREVFGVDPHGEPASRRSRRRKLQSP